MRMRMMYSLMAILLLATCGGKDDGGKMPWDGKIKDKEEPKAGYAVGEVLPAWEKGCLDIHAINSGRGECYLYILPDGTTMLVDAGEVTASGADIQRKPNETTRPYVTYAQYIKHFLPEGQSKLDYMYLTHFHIDHMGEDNSATPKNANGYRTVGVSGVFEEVGFTTLLDRGYPSYGDDKTILAPESAATNNYITFVKYATASKGLKAERIEVGSDSQVKLLHDASYDCKLLTIAGNGRFVKKDADGNRAVDAVTISGENPACCVFHLRYGLFDCIAGADLTSSPQNKMAQYVADFVGTTEVFKAIHHLSANSWGSQMQKTAFSPRTIISEAFSSTQPDPGLLRSIVTGVFENNTYSWNKHIFLTNAHADLVAANPDLYEDVNYNGHVVVRVAPGGDEYTVYMLDDSDFSYRIKSIHGPYTCK